MSKSSSKSWLLSPADDAAQRAGYWPFALVRAILLLVTGLVVTFSADHSAAFGLTVFGVFAILNGLAISVLTWRRLIHTNLRGLLISGGVISGLLGITALTLRSGGVSALFLVLTVWAALTGALELYAGLRCRCRHAASGDFMTVGAFTAVAAVVFVLIPPEFSQRFVGPDHVKRILDAAVVAVGLFGAYAIILAVFLGVAGLSMKWGTQTPPVADELDGPEDVGVDDAAANASAEAPAAAFGTADRPSSTAPGTLAAGTISASSDVRKGTTP